MKTSRVSAILLSAFVIASPLQAEDGDCGTYTRDVSKEYGLMKVPAKSVGSNWNIKQSAMPLEVGEHYLITLHPQNTVGFVVPPSREAREPDPHGGIAYFHAEESGRYRIALGSAHSIDVVDSGANVLDPAQARVLPSVAHRDLVECELLRKIVEFDLDGGKTYRLHFSGRGAARVNVLVTREPRE